MINLSADQEVSLKTWISELRERDPIAIVDFGNYDDFEDDMPVSNYCGDIEIRVFKFSNTYIVVTNDPTEISKVEVYKTLACVSNYINDLRNYEKIIQEDGLGSAQWNFNVRSFNTLIDNFYCLPKELVFLTLDELINIFTSDEFSYLFLG